MKMKMLMGAVAMAAAMVATDASAGGFIGGCCCRPKVDQPYRLKIDQGWKPRAVALGAFGL